MAVIIVAVVAVVAVVVVSFHPCVPCRFTFFFSRVVGVGVVCHVVADGSFFLGVVIVFAMVMASMSAAHLEYGNVERFQRTLFEFKDILALF